MKFVYFRRYSLLIGSIFFLYASAPAKGEASGLKICNYLLNFEDQTVVIPHFIDSQKQQALETDVTSAFEEFEIKRNDTERFDAGHLLSRFRYAEVKSRVDQGLNQSRWFVENSTSFENTPMALKSATLAMQDVFAKQVPLVTGAAFSVQLKEVVRLFSYNGDSDPRIYLGEGFTDPLSGQIYIYSGYADQIGAFIRVLTHESVHLSGHHNSVLQLTQNAELFEGITEYIAVKILISAGLLNGSVAANAAFYKEFVTPLETQVVGKLLKGSDDALMEFYRTGDINKFAAVLRKGFKADGGDLDHDLAGQSAKFMANLKSLAESIAE